MNSFSVEKPSQSSPKECQMSTPLRKWLKKRRKSAAAEPAIQPAMPFERNIPAVPITVYARI